jgi:hypothetical protein
MTVIIMKCSWCGKYLGQKDGKGISGVSHVICKECFKKVYPKVTKSKG